MTSIDLLADLDARGLIHDSTDRSALGARLAEGPISVYVGFDPTADSLHAGNLLGQVMLRRFQLAGHNPVVLAGGATGMVGDPGGRSEERNLLDRDTLAHNVRCVKSQLERILDFDGPHAARLVDNADWTAPMSALEFLRDVGKHFTVNQMVAKESVRARMESENGISYTEFSYMLLQANDFRHLCEHEGVEMQMGGSDQWGNITAGTDLIRRRLARTAYGLTWPLLTRSDGQKMGKSVHGALWLDPNKTSPYQFRQYWIQLPDEDVERFLLQLTLRSVDEIRALVAEHTSDPGRRVAQPRPPARPGQGHRRVRVQPPGVRPRGHRGPAPPAGDPGSLARLVLRRLGALRLPRGRPGLGAGRGRAADGPLDGPRPGTRACRRLTPPLRWAPCWAWAWCATGACGRPSTPSSTRPTS